MKVLFVGPSLYGETQNTSGIVVRPPARQGDIARAVLDGASAIGLVDGYFDAVAAPWHKEILFALHRGVAMLGSSSMGALRAAECAPFGMRPVGQIAQAYLSGALDDDAAVAMTHGPAELGYPPLTEPLVNVLPTLDRLVQLKLISPSDYDRLSTRARTLYFKDRSVEALFADEEASCLKHYRENRVDQKAVDALQLVSELRSSPDALRETSAFLPSSYFSRFILQPLLRSD
jgi:hypothetical protein